MKVQTKIYDNITDLINDAINTDIDDFSIPDEITPSDSSTNNSIEWESLTKFEQDEYIKSCSDPYDAAELIFDSSHWSKSINYNNITREFNCSYKVLMKAIKWFNTTSKWRNYFNFRIERSNVNDIYSLYRLVICRK